MSSLIIHPVHLCDMVGDKSLFTYRLDAGRAITLPVYVWYIEGAKERIVVDAGADTEFMWNLDIPSRYIQDLDSGLAKFGVAAKDIDLVILGHLHQDHVAQGFRFSKARFMVQKDELECALNPHPAVARSYHKQLFEKLNFEPIYGDKDVCEGVSIMRTPGHSTGGQCTVVRTARGSVAISGLCTVQENYEPPARITQPVIPTGISVNLLQSYDSLLRVKKAVDMVLSAHDLKFKDVASIG